ncbi:YadA-like membrane anchor domain protein [compost metagenome]
MNASTRFAPARTAIPLVLLWLACAGAHAFELAPAVRPDDAINLGQLHPVRTAVGDRARIAYSGAAMAIAMSAAYVPTYRPGEQSIGLAFGSYRGYSAAALGFKRSSDDGDMAWGMGVSSTGREWGFNAGIGWKLPRSTAAARP